MQLALRRAMGVASACMWLTAAMASAATVGRPPTFAQPVRYGADPTGTQYVVVGDVFHRGINDLVVTHANTLTGYVSLLPGTGRGTFGAPTTVYAGTSTSAVLIAKLADVNGDGLLDLVMLTLNQRSNVYNLVVALGNGKGHFTVTASAIYPYGVYANFIPDFVVGTFGPDRYPDVVVQEPYGVRSAVFRSDGRGGLSAAVMLAAGGGIGGLQAVDVNHDGREDLVGIGQGPFLQHQEQLQTLFGTGDSRYFVPIYTLPGLQESQSGQFGRTAAAADLRSTGTTDLLVFGAEYRYGVPIAGEVYLGRADGTYEPPLLLTLASGRFGGASSAGAIADFNGDGIPDIVLTTAKVGAPGGTGTFVLSGIGDGTFPPALQTLLPIAPLLPHVVVANLIRGDARPDIAVSDQSANGGVWIVVNTSSKARK